METKVYIRIKPYKKEKEDRIIVKKVKDSLVIENPQEKISKKEKYIKYKFVNIINFFQRNSSIFENIKTYISKNLMLVVYGQTGSGKTHTIIGNKKEKGVIYLSVESLLENKRISNINIQTIQLHNFKVYDVLNRNSELNFYELKESIHYKIPPIKREIKNINKFKEIMDDIRFLIFIKYNVNS